MDEVVGRDKKTGRFLEGNPGSTGRIGKYKPQYVEEVYKLCLLGAVDEEIADFFNIARETVYDWANEHEDFADARRRGKMLADANVCESLYRNAVGYSHPDVHISNYQGDVTVTEIVKHYPPNPTSGIFFLKNRQNKRWKDRQEVDHSGNLSITQLLDQIDGTHTGLPPDED